MQTVYMAGAASDMQRVLHWMSYIRSEGFDVQYDIKPWTIRDHYARRKIVKRDLDTLEACDVLWFLVPDDKVRSQSIWVEFGWAAAKKKKTILSGYTYMQTDFAELATQKFIQDSDAFQWIKDNVRSIDAETA